MGPSPQPPTAAPGARRRPRADRCGRRAGAAHAALQRSADDATWREVDALAVALVLLMSLPAATCRRAPVASAAIALTRGAERRRARLPADVGMVLGAADRGGRRLPHRPPARGRCSATFTLVGDVLASLAAADAAGERLSAFQLVANVCVIGVPLLLADLLREQRRLLAQVRDQTGRLTQLRAAEAGEAAARERVRIARDVHDVVGNDLSAIAVQAGAGRTLVDADPEGGARDVRAHRADGARGP